MFPTLQLWQRMFTETSAGNAPVLRGGGPAGRRASAVAMARAGDAIHPSINAAAGGVPEGAIDDELESGEMRKAKRERNARIRKMRGARRVG